MNFDSIAIPKFFRFDANGDLDTLTDFINDCITYGNNIDILILNGNNKATSIDVQNIKAPTGTLVHITLWNFLNLTINHLELNTDDNNTLVINKCGHNITMYRGAHENTWNIVGGYWW